MANSTTKPRARDLGIPPQGRPGKYNAITDIDGVTVGHETIILGEGQLEIGKGARATRDSVQCLENTTT